MQANHANVLGNVKCKLLFFLLPLARRPALKYVGGQQTRVLRPAEIRVMALASVLKHAWAALGGTKMYKMGLVYGI